MFNLRSRFARGPGAFAAGLLFGALPFSGQAQRTTELLTTALPGPAYQPVQDDHYGTRIGPVHIHYSASTDFIFTDNRNYASSGAESDFGIRPMFNFGLFYVIEDTQKLQVDFGIGYEWWENSDENSGWVLSVAPNSHLNYRLRVGEVDLYFANDTYSSSEASSRAEYAGGDNATGVDFRQLENITTLGALWSISHRWTLNGNYSFGITRSLNDQFTSLDRNTHSVGLVSMYQLSYPIAVGLGASYSKFTYEENVQNDGQSFSVGPRAEWEINRYLHASAGVGYTWTTFDDSGSINDRSDASVPTFNVSLRHEINRRMNQVVTVSREINTGFGSNYTDSFEARYGLQASITSKLSSHFGFSYQRAAQSGPGDTGDLYTVEVGAGYPILRHLNVGLNYSFNSRVGETDARSYTENRVTIHARYTF